MSVLLEAETPSWKLQVVGELPELPAFIALGKNTKIEIAGAGEIKIRDRAAKSLSSVSAAELIEPLFFENRGYEFYLTEKSGQTKLGLPPTAVEKHKVNNVTHYALNFRSEVGFFEFILDSDESGKTIVRAEVFPTKINYREDYQEMRDEVAEISRNLVLAAQARTFGTAFPIPVANPTLLEWISLVKQYFDKFASSADAIAKKPHSKLIKYVEAVAAEKARKVDKRYLSRVLRKPAKRVGPVLPGRRITLPERVLETRSGLTFDTPENRYVKSLLLETKKNLQRVIKTETTGDEDSDLNAEQKFFAAFRSTAREMLAKVQLLLNAPYLREIPAVAPTRPSSMVVDQHPSYSAFERTTRLLNGGLSVGSGVLRIGIKDVALLYEYWCFLKLTKLLAEKFNLEQQNIVRVRHTKIAVVLEKGTRSSIKFRDSKSGKELLLIYNRFFNRLPTINQKPDNVIQLLSEVQMHVLDAKYRLGYGSEYEKQFGGIGPTASDIATMHRYRDAIVLPSATRKGKYVMGVVKNAVVLFPYPNENPYENHRFFQSINSVGIGGVPFLPKTTKLMEKFITSILAEAGF